MPGVVSARAEALLDRRASDDKLVEIDGSSIKSSIKQNSLPLAC